MRSLARSLPLVLLLSAAALAQDGLDRFRKGEQLLLDPRFPAPKDHQVFAVEGHSELAITLVGPEHPSKDELDRELAQLRERRAGLERLAEAGVPTLRVLDVGVVDGRAAYLHRRMATGSLEPNWMTDRGGLLDANTKTQVREIAKKLEASGVGPKDSEIWLDPKGRIFIDSKAVVTKAESEPWSRFYVNQTNGALQSVSGQADLSIAWRKTKLLAEMPGAKDAKLARFFEHGMITFLEGDMPFETALTQALGEYLSKGNTTDFARELGKKVAKGDERIFYSHEHDIFQPKPGELRVKTGRSFPELAFDLVRSGAEKAFSALGDVERSVLADAHALGFFRAKEAPDAVATDGTASRASQLAKDPETLVREAEARAKKPLTPEARAALVEQARGLLGPSRSDGLSGVLDGRIRDGQAPEGER